MKNCSIDNIHQNNRNFNSNNISKKKVLKTSENSPTSKENDYYKIGVNVKNKINAINDYSYERRRKFKNERHIIFLFSVILLHVRFHA